MCPARGTGRPAGVSVAVVTGRLNRTQRTVHSRPLVKDMVGVGTAPPAVGRRCAQPQGPRGRARGAARRRTRAVGRGGGPGSCGRGGRRCGGLPAGTAAARGGGGQEGLAGPHRQGGVTLRRRGGRLAVPWGRWPSAWARRSTSGSRKRPSPRGLQAGGWGGSWPAQRGAGRRVARLDPDFMEKPVADWRGGILSNRKSKMKYTGTMLMKGGNTSHLDATRSAAAHVNCGHLVSTERRGDTRCMGRVGGQRLPPPQPRLEPQQVRDDAVGWPPRRRCLYPPKVAVFLGEREWHKPERRR